MEQNWSIGQYSSGYFEVDIGTSSKNRCYWLGQEISILADSFVEPMVRSSGTLGQCKNTRISPRCQLYSFRNLLFENCLLIGHRLLHFGGIESKHPVKVIACS